LKSQTKFHTNHISTSSRQSERERERERESECIIELAYTPAVKEFDHSNAGRKAKSGVGEQHS